MNAYRDRDEGEKDWDDDDWDDDEIDPGEDSEDPADEEPTVPCPYCKEEILEDSPRCPYCQRYLSEEDHARPRKPLWVFLTALVCLGVAIWWVFAAF